MPAPVLPPPATARPGPAPARPRTAPHQPAPIVHPRGPSGRRGNRTGTATARRAARHRRHLLASCPSRPSFGDRCPLARTHDHAEAVLTHRDTPDNTGKTPDQEPQRLNRKFRPCFPRTQVAYSTRWVRWSRQGGGTIEYRFRHRDGNYIWIQDTFKVVEDEAGKPLEIVGSWADITHRKQVENALGERMALMNDLQNLVAASPAVIYTTQASGEFACTFVSENLKSTMGYSPSGDAGRTSKFWLKRLHPEDTNRVFEELGQLIERGGGSIEYRFRHRRGHYIWIQDTFTATKDKEGKPKELIGSSGRHNRAEEDRSGAQKAGRRS